MKIQGIHLSVKEKIIAASLKLLKECNEAKFALLGKFRRYCSLNCKCTLLKLGRMNLQGELAPFPALFYCFENIDRLRVPYTSDMRIIIMLLSHSHTHKTICFIYNRLYELYHIEQTDILLNLLRQKLVHLAQPIINPNV